ncbi:hypothetical protein ACP26L_28990 [Paenibacillus sp. S-38]|uniref:hypothetical protein n=1 Tax=Paenibacillus sp. S-38 TaxID=3416710 RepID=UPI003CE7E7E8
MLKRYSFFGVTLELLAVAGGFAALLALIMAMAVMSHVRYTRRRKAAEVEERDI